jgi:F0F1-type ATP synthase assembly protein I
MGLAWSAGVAFTGAIVFMLFIGWIADLVLGSSPWGLVGGIILGAIIGFIQFFRISSQIFKTNSDIPAVHPLHVADPDDESRD